MGRRELREEMQRTWVVYEPRRGGTPFQSGELDAMSAEPVADHPTTPTGIDGSRHERRARVAQTRRVRTMSALARVVIPERPVSESVAERGEVYPPARSGSATDSESGR